ncbi:MAG: bis(5'-nucleosyl)-tetraphosphatase (symmetrical) YqeK [Eubacterium sp.]|nr:bis(5'-nucleosyl)-tetraphosphatase (symmetrical) YqeK [Eubacterium sp.]
MSNIGIFGGSFNPPHKAHKAIIKAVLEQYDLDTVYIMPTAKPPHKSNKEYESTDHRIRMCKLMIESIGDNRVKYSDFEVEKGGVSYTYQTILSLKDMYPDDKLYFIIGGDSLEAFPTWIKPEVISEFATILSAPRSDMSYKELKKLCKKRSREFPGFFLPIKLKNKLSGVSSSSIRDEIKLINSKSDPGNNIYINKPEFLNKRIWLYIRLHGLFGLEELKFIDTPDEDTLIKCLRSTLRPKRFIHTLGVADTAEKLGKIYDDGSKDMPARARLAGLLHDCAKYYTDSEQIRLCDKYGIGLTLTERENPSLIHGKLGAYLAEHRYGVKDEEILSAIRLHTVGKPGMSTLEKIIYIADYIEPGRVIPEAKTPLDELRKSVKNDLDGTLVNVIENTIDYLKQTGKVIDEASLATLNYYVVKS